MAPEHTNFTVQDTAEVVKAGDVWCMAVILYAMLAGRYPFDSTSGTKEAKDKHVKRKILQGQYDRKALANCSVDVLELLDGMFKVDPAQRLTLADIMSHRWVLQGTPPTYSTFNQQYNLDVERAYLARKNLDQLDGLERKLAEVRQAAYYNYGSTKKLVKMESVVHEPDSAAVV